MSIDRDEVLEIAHSINMFPSDEQVKEVINGYEYEAEQDPTGEHDLWIEQGLYNAGVVQKTPEEAKTYMEQLIESIKVIPKEKNNE